MNLYCFQRNFYLITQIKHIFSLQINKITSREPMSIEQQKIQKLTKQNSQPVNSFTENSLNDNIPSFLLKTYEILENSKFVDVISWTRNGEGFIVKKVKEFSETILPVYFRHNNYTSFVRQLNMYDFHKTRQQNQQNAFKNFLFKKGHKYLLKQIQRKDYKKNKQTNKQLYNIFEKQKVSETIEGQAYSKIKEDVLVNNPQNQCFRANINALKKVKNQLQDKSLKLMCFKEGELTSQMIMKAIDTLFQCGFATKKALCQVQLLKTDYELNQRKNYFSTLKQKPKPEQKKSQIFATQKIQTKHSLSGFKQPLTEAKTILFSNSEPKATFSGFQRFEPTQISLFNSFRND